MSNSRTGNAIKNSGASLIYRVVHVVLRFVMRTAFIRLLGNEYTGVSSLFTDVLNVLSLMEFGLDSSMIYALYSPVAQKDSKRINALMNFYKKAFLCIGAIVLVVGVAIIPFLGYIVTDATNIKEDIRLIYLMYVVTSASSYFFAYRTTILNASQQSRIISKWGMSIECIENVIELIFLVLTHEYFAYLIIHLIATWSKNIILSMKATKMYPAYFSDKTQLIYKEERKKIYRDIACLTVYMLAGSVLYSTDSIFISAFEGTVAVALVGNFTLIINSIKSIIEKVVNATKPSIGNLAATSDSLAQTRVFEDMNFLSFYVTCFTCTCLFVLLNPFVGEIWLGEDYRISTGYIIIMIINYFIAVMFFPVASFRTANGLFVQGWYRPVIMSVLNIILDFFMGKQFGIVGILLATTISQVLTQVWFDAYLVYKRVFNKKPWGYYKKYVIYALVTACSCFSAWKIASFINIENKYICFVVYAFIAAVVPNIFVFGLYFKRPECKYIFGLLKKLKLILK